MKAFVTGAGGFIGAHLAKELVKKGYDVTGLFMPAEDSRMAETAGIKICRGDITRPETLEGLFDGTDILFHLATRTTDWGAKSEFEKIMVQGTENILRACQKTAPRFVYFSSIAALGLNRHLDGFTEDSPRETTGIPYCDTKIKAEDLVKTFCGNHGIDFTIIRPANVIGPGSVWVKDILDAFYRGPVPVFGGGKVSGAFIYIDNLVDATIMAAESDVAKSQTYHIRDDYDITWGEYVNFLGSHINKTTFGSIPFHVAWYLGRFLETILTPLNIRPPMTRLTAGVFGRNNDVDTSKVKKELGWSSRVFLDEAMERISSWIKEVYIPLNFSKDVTMKTFYQKIVYITGGSSGIGLETGKVLARYGANIVLIARDSEKLEAAKSSLDAIKIVPNQTISVISVDVANHMNVCEKMEHAEKTFGVPDILINSAGINKYADHFENITDEMFNEVMSINVNGVRNVTHALIEPMKSKKGHVVILSSAAALFGMFGYTAYGTSKAALMGFAESLRYELAPLGMPVTAVFPPEVDTPMNLDEAKTLPAAGRAMKSMAGFLMPDYVARVIVKAILKKKYFVIPGYLTRLIYFFHRLTNGMSSRMSSDVVVKWTIRKSKKSIYKKVIPMKLFDGKRKVVIKRCDTYDKENIRKIIKQGFDELGIKPKGNILIKPNIVTANKEYIHHSFTEPTMLEAMVDTLRQDYHQDKVTIGESGGIGIPTRMFFAESGIRQMSKTIDVPLVDFNEEQMQVVTLEKAKLHKTMEVAKSLHEAEFKIWMPKLKFHIVTEITNTLKLNIGILNHKERFLYHDDRLHQKIVDMLEIGYPNVIVSDAITIGKGFESSPYPVQLGAILIANEPLACDMVAARILGYEPESVRHLVEARERGYGSLDFDDITVSGDITIEELADRIKDVESPFQDLSKLDTPLTFYEGINKSSGNICYGGCICSIKGLLGTAEKKYPGTLKKAKKAAIVMGYYEGDVICPDDIVVLVGECAGVSGRLEAKKIIRMKGCPVKVKDLMIFLLFRIGVQSPAFDLRNLLLLIYYSIVSSWMKLTIPLRKKARLEKK